MDDQYMIEAKATFDAEGLRPIPPRIGPFKTRTEAEDWWRVNCGLVHGSWGIVPLLYPYLRGAVSDD